MRAWGLGLVAAVLVTACGQPVSDVSFDRADDPSPSNKVAAGSGIDDDGRPPSEPAVTAETQVASPGPMTPSSTPVDSPTPQPGVRELGQDEDATIGQPYRYELLTHCGISTIWWNGAWWDADPPQVQGGSPPAGWGDPTQHGVMVQVSERRLEFTGDEGQRADFVPRPAADGAPPPCD